MRLSYSTISKELTRTHSSKHGTEAMLASTPCRIIRHFDTRNCWIYIYIYNLRCRSSNRNSLVSCIVEMIFVLWLFTVAQFLAEGSAGAIKLPLLQNGA